MGAIAESNMLLHPQAELPAGVKMATEEYGEGWRRVRAGGKQRLEKSVRAKGWHFIRVAAGVQHSGVGATAPEAIASALKLELRRLGEHSHAVEVERIELTRYPWFILARVLVSPYRIQPEPVLPGFCQALIQAAPPRRGGVRQGAVPGLREMLLAPRSVEAGAA